MRSSLSSTSNSFHLISNRCSIMTYHFRYFQSRPEIFSAATTQDGATAEANTNPFRKDITSAQVHAAAATVGRAGDAAAKFVSSGFKNMQNNVQGVKSVRSRFHYFWCSI